MMSMDVEARTPYREMAVAGHEEECARACDCGAPSDFQGFHAVDCAIYAGAEPLGFTDDSLVWFEGSTSRWGDLLLQDRKAYMAGGYPF